MKKFKNQSIEVQSLETIVEFLLIVIHIIKIALMREETAHLVVCPHGHKISDIHNKGIIDEFNIEPFFILHVKISGGTNIKIIDILIKTLANTCNPPTSSRKY